MAIITVKNRAITLDAAEIPNLDASKITTGNFDASRIGSGTFADARIAASNVSQHATSFDDNKIVNDISTLGLRVHTQENLNASNTNSASFDIFQDSSGITNLTNVSNVDEYIASVYEVTESGGTSYNMGDESGFTWDGSNFSRSGTTITYNTTSYNHSAWTGNSTPLTGNYKMTFTCGTNNRGEQANTNNGNIQVGIFNGNISSWTGGNSPHNNNKAENFLVTHNGALSSGNQQLVFLKQQTSQATTDVALTTNYYLQFVRDASAETLKLYGHASNSDPYTQSGSLLHTYTGYSGSADNDIILGIGYTTGNINSGTTVVANATFKSGITTLAGSSITNATGSFEGAAITAASTNKMGAVITYQDNAGTNTLNTDIILKLSADNGSNYSTATLTALPDFATGIKMAKVNDLSVTAGTQLKYKIEFANQASGSKEARIRGVSLQY